MVSSRSIAVIAATVLVAAATGCSGAGKPATHTVAKTIRSKAGAQRSSSRTTSAANCPSGSGLGRFAFQGRRSLRVLDLGSCDVVTLVHHRVKDAIRWSADGRYIAFGDGAVVPSSGGLVTHPLGIIGGYHRWDWSQSGHELAAIKGTGVVLGGPGRGPRQLLPDGWGASDVLFAPDGRLVVSRALEVRRFRYLQQLWLVDPRTGERERLWNQRGMVDEGPQLAGFSPDGSDVLFWTVFSASIDADGRPLEAVPITGGAPRVIIDSLLYRDYVADCGSRLVIAAGGWRETTNHKHLVAAEPPRWRTRRLTGQKRSWVSPSCPSTGRFVAASAGPGTGKTFTRFGTEHRSIWVLRMRGGHRQRLTFAADSNTTDESPRVSRDGRIILFVRTTTPRHGQPTGRLYALRRVGTQPRRWRLSGPMVKLAHGGNYYGHYGWGYATDWYQPSG
jgi:Tol biopolymer transport system component